MAENIMMGPIRGGCRNEVECENIFGTDEWSALRRGILLRDPMCRICGLRPSKEVHHIRPRFLKGKNHPRNLIGLCLECHDEVHRRINQGIKEVLERSLDINPSNDPYHKQTAKLDDWMGGIE